MSVLHSASLRGVKSDSRSLVLTRFEGLAWRNAFTKLS